MKLQPLVVVHSIGVSLLRTVLILTQTLSSLEMWKEFMGPLNDKSESIIFQIHHLLL